jgi:hypothetical protein
MNNKPTLRSTKDYSLFTVSTCNRDVDPGHMRKLKPSMSEYGWIPAFPMLVRRTSKGGLEIIDGQHRFSLAVELGLAVWFVELEMGYDVARINNAQVPWKTRDYAVSFSHRGVEDYAEVLDFAAENNVPISDAAAMLAGTIIFGNVRKDWIAGTYKITDRKHAERVAYLYNNIRQISGRMSVDQSLRYALIAIARVPGVDYKRLIRNAAKNPERFVKFGSRDGALTMLEFVYNYAAHGAKFPLKIAAENAMKERNPARKQ